VINTIKNESEDKTMGLAKYLEDNREIWIENNRYKLEETEIENPNVKPNNQTKNEVTNTMIREDSDNAR